MINFLSSFRTDSASLELDSWCSSCLQSLKSENFLKRFILLYMITLSRHSVNVEQTFLSVAAYTTCNPDHDKRIPFTFMYSLMILTITIYLNMVFALCLYYFYYFTISQIWWHLRGKQTENTEKLTLKVFVLQHGKNHMTWHYHRYGSCSQTRALSLINLSGLSFSVTELHYWQSLSAT